MKRSLLLCVLSLSSFACRPNLILPADAQVRCSSDAECPPDYGCRAGLCKSLRENQPPRLSLGVMTRQLGPMHVPVTVTDAEGNQVSITAEARAHPGADFVLIEVSGATAIPATDVGVAVDLVWDNADADLSALGCPGYCPELTLRLTAADDFGPGLSVMTDAFAHGNDAPAISALSFDTTTISGNAVVRFTVVDSAGDPVKIDSFVVSETCTFTDAVAVPLEGGQGAAFPGGVLVDLQTSKDGVAHNVTWDSSHGAAYTAAAACIELSVQDVFGARSAVSQSSPVQVKNARTAPHLDVTPVTDLSMVVTAPLQVQVSIYDNEADPCLLLGEYSTDHVTWKQAQTGDPIVSLASTTPGEPPLPHPFTWGISQLAPALYAQVWLRFTVSDTLPGETKELGPFSVDTRAASDTAPPNYVGPPSGTFVHVNDDVLLQWTSRVGASSYTVQVSTDPAFPPAAIVDQATVGGTEYTFHPLVDLSYYWRVASNITPAGQYSKVNNAYAAVHAFGSAVYVYCPASDAACDDSTRIGNASDPLRRVVSGYARAIEANIGEIHLASRLSGPGGPTALTGVTGYPGILVIDHGITVLGGYSYDFSARNITTYQTVLTGGASALYGGVVIAVDQPSQPVTIDGVTLFGPDADEAFGVRVNSVFAPVILSNAHIIAGSSASAAGKSIGVDAASSAIVLSNVAIGTGVGSENDGIRTTYGGSLDATDVVIAAGVVGPSNDGTSAGVRTTGTLVNLLRVQASGASAVGAKSMTTSGADMRQGTVHVSNSSFTGGSGSGVGAYFTYGLNLSDAIVGITGVTALAGSSNGASTGVALTRVAGTIFQSSFTAGTASNTYGGQLLGAGATPLQIDGSVLSSVGGTASTAHGLLITNDPSNTPNVIFTSSGITAGSGTINSYGIEWGIVTGGGPGGSVSLSRCQIGSGPAVQTIGIQHTSGLNLTVSGSRIVTANAIGTGTTKGINAGTGVVFTSNMIRAGNAVTNVHGVESNGGTWTNNVIVTGDGANSFPLYFPGGTSIGAYTKNTLVTGTGSSQEFCIFESSNSGGTASYDYTLVSDCAARYLKYITQYTAVCGGNFGVIGCSGPTLSPPATNTIDGGPATAVFAPGYNPLDFTTWIIAPSGPADRDHNGVWSAGDIGVDPSNTGIP
jgi:hypothetical protein